MKNKKLISEEVSRIKEMMGLHEDTNIIGQNILQGLGDALRKGIAKSMLDAVLPDDSGLETSDFSSSQTPLGVKTSDDSFYKAVLKGVGAPITDENMKFMYAWRQAEGGKAKNNPFNTTQAKPNSTFYNCLKKSTFGCQSGVRNYQSSQDGIDATIKTLKNGRYGNILSSLKSGTNAEETAQDLKASPWGTGQLALKVLRGYNSGSTPKPPAIA